MRTLQTNSSQSRIKLSVVVKWWLIISATIFSLLLLFSFILMRENTLYQKKQMTRATEALTKQIIEETSKKVQPDQTNLTTEGVIDILNEENQYSKKWDNFYATGISNQGLLDSEINIQFFDTSQNLIFKTQKWIHQSDLSVNLDTKEVVENGKRTIQSSGAVFSKETRVLLGYIRVVNRMYSYNLFLNDMRNYYMIALFFFLIFSIVVGYLLAKQMFQPIKDIQVIISSITEENIATRRLSIPKSNDEIKEVSLYFNQLLDKISFYIDQQKHFVEDVSHELRTPVAIVEGHLQMLNRWGKKDQEVLDESLHSSLAEIGRMKGLVQEMLDLSRAPQVREQYRDEEVNINEVVDRVVANFSILYPEFKFTLDIDVKQDIFVSMFINHFEQVLIILMDNAVKYSMDRKEVIVSLSEGFNGVEIAVQDFGMGMTREDSQKVFSRFYRVDKARSRERGGNGLGLSIAKELLTSYDGSIQVMSVFNHGSIFTIFLPVKRYGKMVKMIDLEEF